MVIYFTDYCRIIVITIVIINILLLPKKFIIYNFYLYDVNTFYPLQVCGPADDILDNYIQIVDANVGLYALIDIMESNLFNTFGGSPLPSSSSPQFGSKTLSMKGSAFVV